MIVLSQNSSWISFLTLHRLLDTAGCFSRSISDLKTLGLSWYEGRVESPSFQVWLLLPYLKVPLLTLELQAPSRVLYAPEESNKFSEPKRVIMDAFIEDLEAVLKISKTDFSIASTWNEDAPPSCTRPTQKFLATVRKIPQLRQKHSIDNMADSCSHPAVRLLSQQRKIAELIKRNARPWAVCECYGSIQMVCLLSQQRGCQLIKSKGSRSKSHSTRLRESMPWMRDLSYLQQRVVITWKDLAFYEIYILF